MPCLLLVLLLIFPRAAIVVVFLTSNYLGRAYHGFILPFLGFIFIPLSTLTYAWLVNSHQPLQGANLLILFFAILIDFGVLGGGEHHRRKRW